MAKLISRAEKIIAKLKREGKVKEVKIDSEAMTKMNEEMEKVHRDYINKSQASMRDARNTWVG